MGRPAADEAKLSRHVVVETATAMIERDGLESFSIRGLARELGVRPNAIYWHVPDRAALLGLVADDVLGEVAIPDSKLPWDAWFCEYARGYRRVLHAHPRLVPLINASLMSNTVGGLGLVEAFLSKLGGEGLNGTALVDAYNVVLGCLVGFVGLELAPAPTNDDEAWSASLRDSLEYLDTDHLPTVAAYRDLLINRAFVTRWVSGDQAPMDGAFESMLRVLLAGLTVLTR